jgi:DNA invertase Pin-like site-specific DNA recombinase
LPTEQGISQPMLPGPAGTTRLTRRQAEVLKLAARGLSSKHIATNLGISRRTVDDRFREMRQRTGARTRSELIACAVAAGLVKPEPGILSRLYQEAPPRYGGSSRQDDRQQPGARHRKMIASAPGSFPESRPGTIVSGRSSGHFRDGIRDYGRPNTHGNGVRIGYVRMSLGDRDRQAQLEALTAADCSEIIVETDRPRDGAPPGLRRALAMLRRGDTLVIDKADRIARSVRELLALLKGELGDRKAGLHILSGICAGLHRPDGATSGERMLFQLAAMAADMEGDQIPGRSPDGCAAPACRRSGRPAAIADDALAVARVRRARGESVAAIARHLGVGRSTLYRALQPSAAGEL